MTLFKTPISQQDPSPPESGSPNGLAVVFPVVHTLYCCYEVSYLND